MKGTDRESLLSEEALLSENALYEERIFLYIYVYLSLRWTAFPR